MSKHMLVMKDSSMEEILEFLDKAEQTGHSIPAVIGPQVELGDSTEKDHQQTVAYEARQLKYLFLKLHHGY
jgi:tetratricopeptide repeat protein 30